MPIPREIHGQKYISLGTFRKNGAVVLTPVWFGEMGDRLYVMTRSDSGKSKRLRNNPFVQVAPCTLRGKIIGPTFAATTRILPPEQWPSARDSIRQKYWLARIPWPGRKTNVYIQIDGFTSTR